MEFFRALRACCYGPGQQEEVNLSNEIQKRKKKKKKKKENEDDSDYKKINNSKGSKFLVRIL